jgi:hypothetical protein
MSTMVRLKDTDLKAGIAEIKDFDTVQRWVRRGKPKDDIEMEIPNVIRRVAKCPKYQVVRQRVCDTYGIDERTFVRCLLTHMAGS